MPGRNGTGPMGCGPGTGRGMGYCGIDRSGFWGMRGRGIGIGRGWFGMGRGRMGGFGYGSPGGAYAGGYQAEDLKSYQRYLEEELTYVKSQLSQEE